VLFSFAPALFFLKYDIPKEWGGVESSVYDLIIEIIGGLTSRSCLVYLLLEKFLGWWRSLLDA
jgi:hypothetical protein